MDNDLISRSALKEQFIEGAYTSKGVREIIANAPTVEVRDNFDLGYIQGLEDGKNERPHDKWLITAEDSEGIHRIQCPFCRYEKGSDFIDYITVTFEKLPPFCESCGADMRGEEE